MGQEFRKEIEGLRAIAVLPILLFHLQPTLCPGGFIGVDIFFVISGYLMTRMILADGERFSCKAFYIRRFYRLFPALLAVLAASTVAAWWVLGPREYVSLAQSAIAAGFGVSNFHFLAVVDYFNPAGMSHPLLHTWSLGAEEQFYLVWPALLLLQRRTIVPLWLFIAGIAALSLLALGLLQATHPELVFYMMPFRMFEFAIGAGLISLEKHSARVPPAAYNLAGAIGAALLAAALVKFDRQTPWPSAWTIAPSLATGLLMLAGRRGIWHELLGHGGLRFVGRISYSLYLVHWPLISLYRYHVVIAPGVMELAFLGAASIAIGAALYAAVEIPFRLRGQTVVASEPGRRFFGIPMGVLWDAVPRRMIVTALVATCLAFFSGAAGVIVRDGFPSRLDRTRVQFLDQGLTFAGDLCSRKRNRCVFGDRFSLKVVYVLGDSHALNLIYGLHRLFLEVGIKGIALYSHGCLFLYETKRFLQGVANEKCNRSIADAFALLAGNRRPVVIAGDYAGYRNEIGPADASAPLRQQAGAYYDWLRQRLRASLEQLDATHRTVILFKQAYATGVNLATCLTQPGAAADAKQSEKKCVPLTLAQVQQQYQDADRLLDDVTLAFPAAVRIDPKILFCPAAGCITTGKDGLFFRDAAHLTNAGSDFLIQRARDVLLESLARE